MPTGPALYSGLQTRRPLLIAFYHVEKTGGSAVMKWLHKMANNKTHEPRLTSLFDFTHTTCFFAISLCRILLHSRTLAGHGSHRICRRRTEALQTLDMMAHGIDNVCIHQDSYLYGFILLLEKETTEHCRPL